MECDPRAGEKNTGRQQTLFGDADELVAEVIDNIAQKLLKPREGWTNVFIDPPYDFNAVDSLVTNFHLPKTSLLLMMDAFAG